ncbi:MAG: hypothetical protein HY678_12090 [Chloroflexi bacterium]|nr:hypothetical protein [Chloroflexota bacterium]
MARWFITSTASCGEALVSVRAHSASSSFPRRPAYRYNSGVSTNEAISVSDRAATPARRQWLRAKRQHPGCVLLFRMGDFYETFDDDAKLVAKELEIALTSREMGRGGRIPMAGIPHHALDVYLARLVKRGHRVAICDQTSDPAASKGLVDREVTRVVTPGTVTEAALLDQKANTYLAAVCVVGDQAGLAYVDVSTAQFTCAQVPLDRLPLELERLAPAELLVPEEGGETPAPSGTHVTPVHPTTFHAELARQTLLDHFKVRTLEAFGCEGLPLAQRAAGASRSSSSGSRSSGTCAHAKWAVDTSTYAMPAASPSTHTAAR